jgi:hypothetical protein
MRGDLVTAKQNFVVAQPIRSEESDGDRFP